MYKNEDIKQEMLKLRKENFSYKAIAEKLNCSKALVYYHLGKQHKNKKNTILKEDIFKLRKQGLSYNAISKKLGCSKGTISYYIGGGVKSKVNERQRKNRRAKKQALVDYLGGKCSMCGYDKCLGALEFHHLDPNEKEFSVALIKDKSLDELKQEADKCILVCSNCHKEIHYK